MTGLEHSVVNVEVLLNKIENMETMLSKIFKILEGNGDQGLVTRVALNSQTVDNLPSPTSLKWYAGIGGAAVSCVGIVFYLIVHSIKSAFSGG